MGRQAPIDPFHYFPLLWQQDVPLQGPYGKVRPRRQDLVPNDDPTLLGEVLLRGLLENV